jgi:hypothetical protein
MRPHYAITSRRTRPSKLSSRKPGSNPNVSRNTGVVRGIRVEEIEDPLMQQIRYLDKLVEELARGKAMEKVLRA